MSMPLPVSPWQRWSHSVFEMMLHLHLSQPFNQWDRSYLQSMKHSCLNIHGSLIQEMPRDAQTQLVLCQKELVFMYNQTHALRWHKRPNTRLSTLQTAKILYCLETNGRMSLHGKITSPWYCGWVFECEVWMCMPPWSFPHLFFLWMKYEFIDYKSISSPLSTDFLWCLTSFHVNLPRNLTLGLSFSVGDLLFSMKWNRCHYGVACPYICESQTAVKASKPNPRGLQREG